MATISVHDYDFFHNHSWIPNLECMKYLGHGYARHDLTVLTKQIQTTGFTYAIVRKDYEDYKLIPEITDPKVVLGGRAYEDRYHMLPEEVEYAIPNSDVYDSLTPYLQNNDDKAYWSLIRNSAHLRLDNGPPREKYLHRCLANSPNQIIFHDYNLSYDNADLIKDLCFNVVTTQDGRPRRLTFGTKFPVVVANVDELNKWTTMPINKTLFQTQYNGLLNDEELQSVYNLTNFPFKYNPAYGRSETDQDFEQTLIKIHQQAIYLQRSQNKISLIYETGEVMSPIFKTYLLFMQAYSRSAGNSTFVSFCKYITDPLTRPAYSNMYSLLTRDDARTMLGYIYDKYDNLFYALKYLKNITYKGGSFEYER